MKFTFKWLKEYLDTEATITEICDKLDQIGLEVEEVVDNTEKLKDFNCVLVEEVQNHPDSDHLHICKVKTAKNEVLQIVCGAPNVKSGMKAILAPIGSIIPNGDFKISKSKIRGVESCGMLCSEKELGIGEDHNGIIELDNNTEIGENIAKIKNIDDAVIDINITPNRGDCCGVYGIARDLSATGIGKLKEFKDYTIEAKTPSPIKVEIRDENCLEFAIRYIKDVKNCESPEWLKNKLNAIGITPKSAIVDITNYVMFVLNRPLHCYDADKICESIIVKKSQGGEKFLALDKNEYTLIKDSILITDKNNDILGLAGIIGGNKSATTMETQNIVLESAVFEPISIAKTARSLNINTDAKFRFERGIDFKTTELALNFATYLILNICGGESSEIIKAATCSDSHVCPNGSSKKLEDRVIDFDISSVELILGLKIERQSIIEILKNLGYIVTENVKNLNELHLVIPSWRNDILIKENVVEDIIRIYSYSELKGIKITNEKISDEKEYVDNKLFYDKMWQVSSLLASHGMTEVISWSFIKEDLAADFAEINDNLRLQNPLNNNLAYMRPTMVPCLLTIAKKNQDNAIENISIFEKGKIFISEKPEGQKRVIAGIRTGLTCEKDVFNTSREYDIYDVKKDIFDILKIFNISGDSLIITNDVPKYYHPERSGAIKMGNIILGVFGEIHPLQVNKIGLKHRVNAFELFIDNLPKLKEQKTTQKKKYVLNDLQPVYRDFAFIIDSDLNVGKIVEVVKKINKDLIKEVHIFDIYQGKNMEKNKKSISFSVKIQPTVRTLTGDEIDFISNKIIEEITDKFNGILRDK